VLQGRGIPPKRKEVAGGRTVMGEGVEITPTLIIDDQIENP
jgi:hypothetical protein